MTGRTSGRWALLFLLPTTVVVFQELFAAFDGDPRTSPWTHLLVDFVPAPATMAAVGVLVVWLPVHLVRAYQARRRPPGDERAAKEGTMGGGE